MVSVFKKKPEGKPGGGPPTTIRPMTVPPTPPPATVPPPPPPPPALPPQPAVTPVTEFVAPKAPVIMPAVQLVSAKSAQTQKVTEEHIVATPAPRLNKVVVPSTVPAPVATAPATVPPPPAPEPVPPHVEKKSAHHGHPKTSLDLVISLQQGTGEDWDAVIRVPVQVFKLANLIPARAREAIESEGIAFEELRKAVEHAEHPGPLLDIQTQTQRVHITIEPHA